MKQLIKSQLSFGKKQTRLKLAILLLFQFISISLLSAQAPSTPAQTGKNAVQFPQASAYTNANLTYKIIDAANSTFCYDIYNDGKLLIHQSSIPGLQGNEGFKTKAGAEKVALLVISKIKKGEMPPTVSIEELQKLNVIK